MITIKKLSSLKDGTRQRKEARLTEEWENSIYRGLDFYDSDWIEAFLKLILSEIDVPKSVKDAAEILEGNIKTNNPEELLRLVNNLKNCYLSYLGQEPADWDLKLTNKLGINSQHDLEMALYLEDIRSPFNLGSIFRTAVAFGVKEIFLSKHCVSPTHPRAIRSSMGTIDMINWSYRELNNCMYRPFALELNGTEINKFRFPKKAIAVIGSEELGVTPKSIDSCNSGFGRVSIPLYGEKGSLNVGVATGILLSYWSESFSD